MHRVGIRQRSEALATDRTLDALRAMVLGSGVSVLVDEPDTPDMMRSRSADRLGYHPNDPLATTNLERK
jgi:hypothetical protein